MVAPSIHSRHSHRAMTVNQNQLHDPLVDDRRAKDYGESPLPSVNFGGNCIEWKTMVFRHPTRVPKFLVRFIAKGHQSIRIPSHVRRLTTSPIPQLGSPTMDQKQIRSYHGWNRLWHYIVEPKLHQQANSKLNPSLGMCTH